jgi:hypothetical protein
LSIFQHCSQSMYNDETNQIQSDYYLYSCYWPLSPLVQNHFSIWASIAEFTFRNLTTKERIKWDNIYAENSIPKFVKVNVTVNCSCGCEFQPWCEFQPRKWSCFYSRKRFSFYFTVIVYLFVWTRNGEDPVSYWHMWLHLIVSIFI